MIIRAILGLILSGGLAVGALYGAGEYLGIRAASADEIADIEPGEPEGVVIEDNLDGGADDGEIDEEEPPYEPRLELPYEEGGAASWLASVLDGKGPYEVDGEMVDLAAVAQRAVDGDGSSAMCDSSHVAFSCNLTDEVAGVRYGFGLQNNAEGGYEIPFDSVRAYEPM